MRNTVKKAMAIAIAVSMTTSIATVGYNKIQAQETNKTVTFSVEKFTIGQGYVVEPVSVEVSDDMTISDVFEKVMNEKEIKYTGSKDYGYLYLQSIENADTGIIDIPEEIAKCLLMKVHMSMKEKLIQHHIQLRQMKKMMVIHSQTMV